MAPKKKELSKSEMKKVEKFVEKPNLETAKKYLNSENYYWNGGIFMGRISTFLNEFKKYTPEIYANLEELDFLTSTQIDYAVYETYSRRSNGY